MSTLFVNNLNTASGTTITVPTGKTLVGTDEGAFRVPGTILQVVQAQSSSSTSFTTGSYSDLISQAITPKSTSSKIKITFNGIYYANHTGSSVNNRFRVVRDGSGLSDYNGAQDSGTGQYLQYRTSAVNNHIPVPAGFTWIHSPNTTSSTTFKIQCRANTGTFQFYGGAFLILEEIAQ